MQFYSKTLFVGLSAVSLLFSGCTGEAWDARRQLSNANLEERIAAIEKILTLALEGEVSGWQGIQEQGCRDAEPRVRVAALEALGQFVEARPNEVVKRSLAGGEWVYVDERILKTMGSDESPDVRAAAARFWGRADALWSEGVKNLKEMLDSEKDEKVLSVAREALAMRLERSIRNGDLKAEEADQVRETYELRGLHE